MQRSFISLLTESHAISASFNVTIDPWRRRLISTFDGLLHISFGPTVPRWENSCGSEFKTCHSCPNSSESSNMVFPSRATIAPAGKLPINPRLPSKWFIVGFFTLTLTNEFQVLKTISSRLFLFWFVPRLIINLRDFSFTCINLIS